MAARALAQTITKFDRILPTHLLHRALIGIGFSIKKASFSALLIISTLKAGRIWLQLPAPAFPIPGLPTGHLSPLDLGDRRLAHEKTIQRHQMLGAFIVITLRLLRGRAHQEFPLRDLHQRDCQRISQFRDGTWGKDIRAAEAHKKPGHYL